MLNYDLYPYKAEMEADASTELRIQQNTKRKVSMMQGELITNIREDILGVGCRVYKNGLYGFASTPDLSSTGIKGVLKKASQNAGLLSSKIKTAKPAMLLPVGNGRYVTDYMMKTSDQKVYIDALRELDSYIIKNCPGLLNRSIVATEDSMEKLLAVSEGHDSHSTIPRSYIYVFMTVEGADGSPVEVFEPIGGFGVFEDNFASLDEAFKVTDELYKRAMDKKTAVYAKAGLKTCILGGHLTGMLAHEAVGHTCESDLVLSGSVAGEYLGKEVASSLVSMTDFAYEAYGKPAPLPVYVDDEGTKACDAKLIENGILTGYLNNRETAEHFNMQPCGNARGFMFYDEPLIRMRNTAVLPGSSTLEEMIASVDDGYYLIGTNNGQADSTGEFMFGVTTGYEIKNGKLGNAIMDTTISGIAFEMLKTVDMVGKEINWASSGFCGKKQWMPVGLGGPALRCKIMMGGR